MWPRPHARRQWPTLISHLNSPSNIPIIVNITKKHRRKWSEQISVLGSNSKKLHRPLRRKSSTQSQRGAGTYSARELSSTRSSQSSSNEIRQRFILTCLNRKQTPQSTGSSAWVAQFSLKLRLALEKRAIRTRKYLRGLLTFTCSYWLKRWQACKWSASVEASCLKYAMEQDPMIGSIWESSMDR